LGPRSLWAQREQEAEQRMLGTRRSPLTAKEKSQINRSRGKQFYDAVVNPDDPARGRDRQNPGEFRSPAGYA
jgi:hypothetical protein